MLTKATSGRVFGAQSSAPEVRLVRHRSASRWLPGLATFFVGAAMGWSQIPWANEPFSRQNKFEVYGVGQYLHQGNTEYPNPGGGTVKLKLDDTGLGGIGFAYHFSDFFSIHSDFMFGPATFKFEYPGGTTANFGDNGYLTTGRFNLDYNIINRRLSPFITAGIGYQFQEVDQDYYYGTSYYYETDFTWNVAGGIRWNVTDNLILKLAIGGQWLQYENANNITSQFEVMFSIGCMF
jgi:opacity protein-like surface antigen